MVARYVLDTDMCIYLKRHRPASVAARLKALQMGEVVISLITYGELINGALKSQESDAALVNVKRLAERLPVMAMTPEVGEVYGEIRSQLEVKGTPIGGNDLWIAAHTVAEGLTLVTNNTREFSRIGALSIENWVE